jgi:RNA polymerase sigma factor (sigma-70 family)
MKLLADGIKDAAGELFVRHNKRVWSWCRRGLHPRTDQIDDAVQDTFLRVVRSAHTFKEGAPLLPWLSRVTRSACIELARKNLISPVAETRLVKDPAHSPLNLRGVLPPAPIDNLIREERNRTLQETIEGLGPKEREWFCLQMRGTPYSVAAEMRGQPLGTVKSSSNKAKKILAEALAQRGIDKSDAA